MIRLKAKVRMLWTTNRTKNVKLERVGSRDSGLASVMEFDGPLLGLNGE